MAEGEITLKQAAELIGRNDSTLRRAAMRGTLKARREDTPRGVVWYTTEADALAYAEQADRWPASPGAGNRRPKKGQQ